MSREPETTEAAEEAVEPAAEEPTVESSDEEESTGEESAADEAAAPERPWLSRNLVPILAALVAVMVVVVASLGYKVAQASTDESNRTQALAAAKTAAKAIFSYDYRHYERDVSGVKRFLTGRFAREYAKTNKTVVSRFVGQLQAVAVGEVLDASVISSSRDRVNVLVFIDQTTDNKVRDPRREHTRLRLSMDRVGDRWLVGEVAEV